MTQPPRRPRHVPPVAITRDRAREQAADRVARDGGAADGKVGQARAPAALGLGPGQAMPAAERGYFEHRLGKDLSGVRLHPDSQAASALSARGFAAGRDIGLAPGEWRPGAQAFRRLLGHELAHVLDQGRTGPAVQLDDPQPEPMFKEAKAEEASDAVGGGLKTVVDKGGDQLKDFGKAWAKQNVEPVWDKLSTPEKVGVAGMGVTMYGMALGGAIGNPQGRDALSDINLATPLKAVPYSTFNTFSYKQLGKGGPWNLTFGFDGADLLELGRKEGLPLPQSLTFDFTLSIAPNGQVTMPFAMARFGVVPGLDISAGWGLTPDWKTMVQPQPGAPLAPYESYPKGASPAPRGEVGAFVNVDLLKLPKLGPILAPIFGGAPPDARPQRDKGP